MTDQQAALPTDRIDPRLPPHLEPGERVLWQGRPDLAGLLPRTALLWFSAFGAVLVLLGVVVTLAGRGAVPLWFPLLFIGVGVGTPGLMLWAQGSAARGTVYALTDRRALHVLGGRLVRAEGPEQVEEVKLLRRGADRGDVYWRTEQRSTGAGQQRGTVTIRVGFLGMSEPETLAARVTAWRDAALARSAELAARFADAVEDGRVEALVASGDARLVPLPEAGLRVAAPADWRRVTALTGDVVAAGGLGEAVLSVGRAYRTLRLVGPGGGVFEATEGKGAPPRGFEEARAPRTGFALISAEPALRIGPWAGYSVAHRVTGVQLPGVSLFAADALRREIVLDLGGRQLVLRMVAPAPAHDVQRALDAMARTLAPA